MVVMAMAATVTLPIWGWLQRHVLLLLLGDRCASWRPPWRISSRFRERRRRGPRPLAQNSVRRSSDSNNSSIAHLMMANGSTRGALLAGPTGGPQR